MSRRPKFCFRCEVRLSFERDDKVVSATGSEGGGVYEEATFSVTNGNLLSSKGPWFADLKALPSPPASLSTACEQLCIKGGYVFPQSSVDLEGCRGCSTVVCRHGEPLAKPWGATTSSFDAASMTLAITTTLMAPGKTYELLEANDQAGPWSTVVSDITPSQYERATIDHSPATARFYQLAEVQ